jgi:hypothetical protein
MTSEKESKARRRIEEILRLRQSPLAKRVTDTESARHLPRNIREQIVEELSDEFCEKGLDPDSEPNAYGLEIEDLIDACGLAHDRQ